MKWFILVLSAVTVGLNGCSLRPAGMLDTVINQKDMLVEPRQVKPDNHLGNPEPSRGLLRGKID